MGDEAEERSQRGSIEGDRHAQRGRCACVYMSPSCRSSRASYRAAVTQIVDCELGRGQLLSPRGMCGNYRGHQSALLPRVARRNRPRLRRRASRHPVFGSLRGGWVFTFTTPHHQNSSATAYCRKTGAIVPPFSPDSYKRRLRDYIACLRPAAITFLPTFPHHYNPPSAAFQLRAHSFSTFNLPALLANLHPHLSVSRSISQDHSQWLARNALPVCPATARQAVS